MQDFLVQSFADGSIVYVIFAFMFIEGIALIAFRRVTGSGPGVGQILSLMLPGAFLLMALKAALGGAPWPMIACWLLAALIAHLADVWGRLNYEAASHRNSGSGNGNRNMRDEHDRSTQFL